MRSLYSWLVVLVMFSFLPANISSAGPFQESFAKLDPAGMNQKSTTSQNAPEIYSKVLPGVASLHVEGALHVHKGKNGKIHPSKSRGTGFFIDSNGLMITNQHVVQTARKIRVVFNEGHERTAEVIGSDVAADVALLKVNCEGLVVTPLALGDSEQVQPGQPVFAIGHPLGLKQSVSLGTISALHRHEIRPRSEHRYSDFIQTDAAINKGSSGGPLFNAEGEVIGMNTAIKKKGRGLAFSIPSNMIKALIPHLKEGAVKRSWLGISIAADERPAEPQPGIRLKVNKVIKNSPAEKAGLKTGDVLVSMDGHPIISTNTFSWKTGMKGAGKSVVLEVIDNETQEVRKVIAVLEAKPESTHKKKPAIRIFGTEDIQKFWGVSFKEDQKQLLVDQVDPGSKAEKAGLRTDDVVVRLGQDEKRNEQGLLRAAVRASKSRVLELEVKRKNRRYYIPVEALSSKSP